VTSLSSQRVFSIAELAQYGSPRTWRRIIASGQIGVIRIGGTVKILEAELEKFLAARFVPARAACPVDKRSVVEVLDSIVPRRRGAR
jgi:hypothetical protein